MYRSRRKISNANTAGNCKRHCINQPSLTPFFIRSCHTEHILKNHIRIVHENAYRHVCEICAKSFSSKSQLDYHGRSVHGTGKVEKFKCNLCDAMLATKLILNRHRQRMHERTSQQCTICGKVLVHEFALRLHIKSTHNSEGPTFPCRVCDKSFKRSRTLKEHMATHTGVKIYSCAYCAKKFNSSANMCTHKKRVHQLEWERERAKRIGMKNGGDN